jgi:hypothetical protein
MDAPSPRFVEGDLVLVLPLGVLALDGLDLGVERQHPASRSATSPFQSASLSAFASRPGRAPPPRELHGELVEFLADRLVGLHAGLLSPLAEVGMPASRVKRVALGALPRPDEVGGEHRQEDDDEDGAGREEPQAQAPRRVQRLLVSVGLRHGGPWERDVGR